MPQIGNFPAKSSVKPSEKISLPPRIPSTIPPPSHITLLDLLRFSQSIHKIYLNLVLHYSSKLFFKKIKTNLYFIVNWALKELLRAWFRSLKLSTEREIYQIMAFMFFPSHNGFMQTSADNVIEKHQQTHQNRYSSRKEWEIIFFSSFCC